MTRDDQLGEDAVPRDLEQALRSSRAELESSVAGKLDIEAGLAAVLRRKVAAAPPAANPARGMSFEDFMRSRSAGLYWFAYVVTGNRDDAEDLVQEAMIEVLRSWGKHAESMGPARMDRYVRVVMLNNHAERSLRQRGYPHSELKGKMGGPAVDDADTEFVLRAINQMPRHMRDALALLFLTNMTADEVAKRLGLSPDAMRDYLMMARKAGLDVETRFQPGAKGR